ncbi:MAG: hypothetical protein AAGG07_12385 [Planctomycetota bacterium]
MTIDVSMSGLSGSLQPTMPRRLPSAVQSAGSSQRSFAESLAIAQRGPLGNTASAQQGDEQRAREAAERFVAMTFVEPVLASLRDSNSAAEPFKPNQAEKQFRGMLDNQLAERVVSAADFPLVDRLASDLLRTASSAAQPTAIAQEERTR